MLEATVAIRTLSEWLITGERDRSTGVDAAQLRDEDGLPCVPGRTLKGLLREQAAETVCALSSAPLPWGETDPPLVQELFGTEAAPGALNIDAGKLPLEFLDEWLLLSEEEKRSALRDLVSMTARTAIDSVTCGAKDHSLRIMEVGIPGLVLLAPVAAPDENALDLLCAACAGLRELGSDRNRGLGRVEVSVYYNGAQRNLDDALDRLSARVAI
ncbi:MAG: hypothetical protein HYV27_08055 [Candidatus Hydrogenedentes bacterium]|nr:hypothetical protein [Candidatus Hydrogenedentota bacterium]